MNASSLALFTTFFTFMTLTAAELKMPELYDNPPPRVMKIDRSKSLPLITDGRIDFEVVVPDDAGKTAEFAGEELCGLLKKATGKNIPLVKTRTPGVKYAIILGDCNLSRKNGIDVSKLTRDAFILRTVGNEFYIAGQDDKAKDTKALLKHFQWLSSDDTYARATLFGAYDFLERFAGMRFYFVGEIGTVIPKLKNWTVPAIDIMERPDNQTRSYYGYNYHRQPEWYTSGNAVVESHVNSLRLRTETRKNITGHGLQSLGLSSRFGKTHPEYFALRKDGSRFVEYPGFICLTNKELWKEILLDIKSSVAGEPPEKRGVQVCLENGTCLSKWSNEFNNGSGVINISLMDGFQKCQCAECRKYYENESGMGEIVWEMQAWLAEECKKANLPVYLKTAGYHFYNKPPKADLPDNLLAIVSVTGPWEMNSPKFKDTVGMISGWHKKLGRKVDLWVYMINRWNNPWTSDVPFAPEYTPKAAGNFFRMLKNDISGSFVELELDRFPIDAMNAYVSMKILWDTSLDPDAIMDEYYAGMFGNAAPEMKAFFEALENIWMKEICSTTVDTPLGPINVRPPSNDVWERIYSKERIQNWQKLFAEAEKSVAADSIERKRIDFMRKHFLSGLEDASKKYYVSLSNLQSLRHEVAEAETPITVDGVLSEDAWKKAVPLYLANIDRNKSTDIQATVRLMKTNDTLYVAFESLDSMTKELITGKGTDRKNEIWNAATFEMFFNPNGDRKNYFQLALTPDGAVYDLSYPSRSFWSDDIAHAEKISDGKWSAEVAIPLKWLPGFVAKGFPANFCYSRRTEGAKKTAEYFSWSPYVNKSFSDPNSFSLIAFVPGSVENLVEQYDFEGIPFDSNSKSRLVGKRWMFNRTDPDACIRLDPANFITGGQSFYGSSKREGFIRNLSVEQHGTKLKPNTKYIVSFFLKTDLAPKSACWFQVMTKGLYVEIPKERIYGKTGWKQYVGEFTTGNNPDVLNFYLMLYGAGEFNLDHVIIKEIK